MTEVNDQEFEAINKQIERISNNLDREAGLPIPSDAPRLIELLLLNIDDRVKVMDIVNDIHDDRYHERGIFSKKSKRKKRASKK
jgi:hypothetical protein